MQEYHIPSQFGSQEQKERKIIFFLFPASTYMMTFTIKTSLLTRPALVLQMNPRNM
jgi:hypothetical protein